MTAHECEKCWKSGTVITPPTQRLTFGSVSGNATRVSILAQLARLLELARNGLRHLVGNAHDMVTVVEHRLDLEVVAADVAGKLGRP